jgi:hypothetical protein
MTLATELATELHKLLKAENFIYCGSLDPANDLIPVPRYLVETTAEMLELLQQQVLTLRALSRAIAKMTDEFAAAAPFTHPNVERLRQSLAAVEKMRVIT